jgi:hypothetical protein
MRLFSSAPALWFYTYHHNTIMPLKRARKPAAKVSISTSLITITLGDKQQPEAPTITPSIEPPNKPTLISSGSSYPLEPFSQRTIPKIQIILSLLYKRDRASRVLRTRVIIDWHRTKKCSSNWLRLYIRFLQMKGKPIIALRRLLLRLLIRFIRST